MGRRDIRTGHSNPAGERRHVGAATGSPKNVGSKTAEKRVAVASTDVAVQADQSSGGGDGQPDGTHRLGGSGLRSGLRLGQGIRRMMSARKTIRKTGPFEPRRLRVA